MAQALYSKYRPKTFDDVIGQSSILKTLKNSIKSNKVSHAYMFCGPRGTGKTTMARLLAKSCMCQRCDDGHPVENFCGQCQNCDEISKGMHPDVYELDAASRTGVENVRDEIISRVGFAPTRGSKKIYIIDEVHMLSTAAFNALLKTLEEPPEHVIFILCTTDPEKVPDTILSRCQRFDFSSISNEDIVQRLKLVCEKEKVQATDDALFEIAQSSNGAMRNALTQLEQLISFTDGNITKESIQGAGSQDQDLDYSSLIENIGMRNLPAAFEWIDAVCQNGADFHKIYEKLSCIVRDMYLASCGSKIENSSKSIIDAHLSLYSSERLHHIMSLLYDLGNQFKVSTNLRLSFELTMAKICNPKSDLTLESLAERISNLEIVATAGDLSPAFTVENFGQDQEQKPKPEHMRTPSHANTTNSDQAQNSSHDNPLDSALKHQNEESSQPEKKQETSQEVPKMFKEDFNTKPNQQFEAGTIIDDSPKIMNAQTSGVASAELTNPNLKIPEKIKPTNFAAERDKIKKKVVRTKPAQPKQEIEPEKNEEKNDFDVQKLWQQIYSNIRKKMPAFGATLLTADATFNKDTNQLILKFPNKDSFSVGVLKKPESMKQIHEEVKAVMGQDIGFNIEVDESKHNEFAPAFVNNFRPEQKDEEEQKSSSDAEPAAKTTTIKPQTAPQVNPQPNSQAQPQPTPNSNPQSAPAVNPNPAAEVNPQLAPALNSNPAPEVKPQPTPKSPIPKFEADDMPDIQPNFDLEKKDNYRPSQDLNTIKDILNNSGAYNITEE